MEAWRLKEKTCCFTGHRVLPKGEIGIIAQRTAQEIRELIMCRGVRFFGVGGAIGYDTLAAKVLFQIKQYEFPAIRIVLVYPFDGFTSRWTREQQSEYQRLLPQYDKVVRAEAYAGKNAYFSRNQHLVDGSRYCIAYCTRSSGGTAFTLQYAAMKGLEIRNIACRAPL